MDKRNRTTLVFALIVVVLVAYPFVCCMYSGNIPQSYIFFGFLALEMLYVVPVFNDSYSKLYGEPLSLKDRILSCVPFYGYTVCMHSVVAAIVRVLLVLQVIFVVLTLFPSFFQVIFSTNDLLIAGDLYTAFVLGFFFLLNVAIGIGLYMIVCDVNKKYRSKFTTGKGFIKIILEGVPFLGIFLLILPVLRLIVLLTTLERLQDMIKLFYVEEENRNE